jgi:hypothetical protein
MAKLPSDGWHPVGHEDPRRAQMEQTNLRTRRRRVPSRLAAGLGVVALVGMTALPASAADPTGSLISDGDFSTPAVGSSNDTFCATGTTHPECDPAGATIGSWTVQNPPGATAGSVDVYSQDLVGPPPDTSADAQWVDLNGEEEGEVFQIFADPADTTSVTVSFDAAANILPEGVCNGGSSWSFQWGIGALDHTETVDTSNAPGAPASFSEVIPNLTPGMNYALEFASTTPGVCGALITNVDVQPVASSGTPLVSIPVAGGAVGLLAAGGGVWLLRRRQRSLRLG